MLFRKIYKAARWRSLPLSVAGIVMGSGLALNIGTFKIEIFLWAILSAICLQLLSDFANDYGDFQKGVDNANRQGPRRAIQNGMLTLKQMKRIIISMATMAVICILTLIWISFSAEGLPYAIFFILLGGSAIYAAVKYTIGASAYGYRGLGDMFVFIFFGIVSVAGSCFLHSQSIEWSVFLPAVAIGLLSVGVLNLNNLRDISNDRTMGKNTIPVRIGEEWGRMYQYFLIVIAMVLMMGYSLLTLQLGVKILYIVAFVPLVLHLLFIRKNHTPKDYDSQLKVVALSTFFLSLLFFVGQIM